jgi:hypothetical protein
MRRRDKPDQSPWARLDAVMEELHELVEERHRREAWDAFLAEHPELDDLWWEADDDG